MFADVAAVNKFGVDNETVKLHKQHGIPPLHLDKKGESQRTKWGLIKGVDLNHIKSHANQKGAAKAYKERVAKRALEGEDSD